MSTNSGHHAALCLCVCSATRQEKSDTPGRVKAIGGHWVAGNGEWLRVKAIGGNWVVGDGGLVIRLGNWWLQESRQLVAAGRQAMRAGCKAIGGCREAGNRGRAGAKAIGGCREAGNRGVGHTARQFVAAERQAMVAAGK